MKEISCSFSGYRPSKLPFGFDEKNNHCIRLKSMLKSEILNLIEKGYNTFRSGMALGIDLWAAEVVLEFKNDFPDINLCSVIPCMGQEKSWSYELKKRYNNILIQADDVLYMNQHYTKDCMRKRNEYLVKKSQLIFAVFDGKKGGTYQTISFAKKLNKEIIILNPNTLNLTYHKPMQLQIY